jgi:hypothetical protein
VTAGQALDAPTEQLGSENMPTVVIVQHLGPDKFFGVMEQQRLSKLQENSG